MKIRYWVAIVTGMLVAIASVVAQWIWTQRPIEDILFIAILAYCIGIAGYLVATEPKRKQPRRKHRAKSIAPENRYESGRPIFITLNKEEWNNEKQNCR